jgi:hypothetical protein
VVAAGELEDPLPAVGGQRHAGRVVEVGDGVEELDPTAVTLETFEGCCECVGIEAVVVEGHVADVDLVLREGGEGADVGWALGHDHVARVAEHAGDQVQRLLGALGDHDVAPGAADALVPHQVGEDLAQPWVALAAGVLEGGRALVGEHLLEHVPDDVEGQRGREGHAAGEADDLGSRGDREQRPDLGGGHRAGAAGVAVTKWVVGAHDPEG